MIYLYFLMKHVGLFSDEKMLRVRCAACDVYVDSRGALRAHWLSDSHIAAIGPWQKKEAEQDRQKRTKKKKK